MKAAALLLLLPLVCSAEPWTGADKDKHFLVGGAVSAAVASVAGQPWGAAAGCGLGLAKELYDLRAPGHTPSVKDAAVTCLGALAGEIVPGLRVAPGRIALHIQF